MLCKYNVALVASGLSVMFLLNGCSYHTKSAPAHTFGEKLKGRGGDIQKIGEQWTKGDKLIKKGDALVQSGNKNISKGQALIAQGKQEEEQGESYIIQGNQIKTDANRAYREKAEKPVANTSS